jgi:hypothetical protein
MVKDMSNKIVIPTPVECDFTENELSFSGFKVENSSLPAPYALKMGHALLREGGQAKLIFTKLDHENGQAYKICIKEKTISIEGASEIAFIYAMSTLLQLAEISDKKIILPEGKISDYPEYEYRGVNWNLFVETGVWSQDAGDGLDALITRFISGLDTLAFFKLNVAYVDGFGWHPERFSGYGELMRTFNREARKRGIKLVYGGYNAGYGAQWHDFDGPKFQNKKSYPDGEVYSCIDPQRHSEIGSKMGTCLSNKALLEAKKKNLIEFVKAVEPGMLYVHGIDIDRQEQAKKAWGARCPECRERWLNDAVNAENGMAGAFSEFYDELYEAIASVKNPGSGYDASKDCIVNMVSPNYTNYSESDDEWKNHIEYFKIVSDKLKNRNIHLMLREQFFNESKGVPRFKQLREAVGQKQKLSVVYFSSGSTFYNSLPVTGDAACIKYFEGMDAVIAGSGNAFQEPRQAIYAEYMWNPKGSVYSFELPDCVSNIEFKPFYHDLRYGRISPDVIFGESGLLELVCKKLYGKSAGKLVKSCQKLVPFPDFDPEPLEAPGNIKTISIAPAAPVLNTLLPGSHFSIFNKFRKIYWRKDLSSSEMDYARRCQKIMPTLAKISMKATDDYKRAASICESELPLQPAMRQRHLERMSETCFAGGVLAGYTERWLEIFEIAYGVVFCERKDKLDISAKITTLLKELGIFIDGYQKILPEVIDPNKADVGQVVSVANYIIRDLQNISHTLDTGKFKNVETEKWY